LIPKWTARFFSLLSKAGWSWGYVSATDREGRTIWIVDAHRDDGQRFVVHADEKLTAFLELESAIRAAECPQDCGGREIRLDKLSRRVIKPLSVTSPDVSTHLRPG
jgi:hypothetical protein